QTVGDWTTVRYSGTNSPQARFDENSASEWPQTDVIQASVIQDWDAVGAWAKNLFDSPAKPVSPAYQTLLSDLRRLPSQPEQAESALRWVQREIRYVSLSLSENSHLPHAPDEVLSRRFGDCKDKTLLLTHLLRDLGLQAHPALMSLQTPTAPRKVSPAPIFDHAVVVAWINMKMHVLDATLPEQVSSLDYFSPWHAGADLFVLDGPFSGFVAAPQSAPLGLNRLTSHETMKIQANGQQGVLSVEVTHEGVYADETRWLLGRKGVEAAKALYLTEMRNRFPDAQWNEEPEAIDDALRNRLILKGSFSVGTPLKRALNSRWRFEYNNGDVMSQLPTTGGVGRVSPLDLGQFLNQVVLRRTLELPEGWLVDEENFDESTTHPAFKARVRRSVSGNAISDEWQLQLLANHISLDSLKGYLDAVKSVEEMPTHIQLRSASHAR
ncbi:MAG: transglutaminase domain-containing protein, partial [Hydrogenophaga sp.]|nr:transglutaminase domain-containing protein [Hydrogenophaga sp.]